MDSGCQWIDELQLMEEHLQSCDYQLVQCPNGCIENEKTTNIPRQKLEDHLTNECCRRIFECPYCSESGEYKDMISKHLDICTGVSVNCRNEDCHKRFPRSNASSHSDVCEYEMVPCKYADVGCDEKILRKDLKTHDESNRLHLKIAIDTVRKLKQYVAKLTRNDQDMAKHVTKTMQEVAELTRNVTKNMEDVAILIRNRQDMVKYVTKTTQDVAKLTQNVTKSTQDVNALTRSTQNMDKVIRNKGYTFMVLSFDRKKRTEHSGYHTPSIYAKGYKISISVVASGYGDATGYYVSVYAHLEEGRYDDSLVWPFPGTITIELLNQLEDKNHYRMNIAFPADQMVMGYPQFIAHSMLDYVPGNNYQYLKNDTLIFRVSVDVPEHKPWLECNN